MVEELTVKRNFYCKKKRVFMQLEDVKKVGQIFIGSYSKETILENVQTSILALDYFYGFGIDV